MLELIESSSLVSGTFAIVGVSIALAFLWARVTNAVLCWMAALGTPFLLSYCLYWSHVSLGADRSEYSAWAGVLIVPWSLIGGFASGVVVLIVRRHIHAKAQHTDA
jgi:hypothetical protein